MARALMRFGPNRVSRSISVSLPSPHVARDARLWRDAPYHLVWLLIADQPLFFVQARAT
jgi:hypothetical protein